MKNSLILKRHYTNRLKSSKSLKVSERHSPYTGAHVFVEHVTATESPATPSTHVRFGLAVNRPNVSQQ